MIITKQEAERILKSSAQDIKTTAVTFRKNDTTSNKKAELTTLISLVNGKLSQGKEMTVIVIETN
jgi:hypothetical protein